MINDVFPRSEYCEILKKLGLFDECPNVVEMLQKLPKAILDYRGNFYNLVIECREDNDMWYVGYRNCEKGGDPYLMYGSRSLPDAIAALLRGVYENHKEYFIEARKSSIPIYVPYKKNDDEYIFCKDFEYRFHKGLYYGNMRFGISSEEFARRCYPRIKTVGDLMVYDGAFLIDSHYYLFKYDDVEDIVEFSADKRRAYIPKSKFSDFRDRLNIGIAFLEFVEE